jgi:Tfp pilus assembly protein FimT
MDLLAVTAILGTLAAVATPQLRDSVDRMRLGMAVRDVERELQYARLKSVSANRPMRVRFNCPAAAQLRVVELIGSTQTPDVRDAAANRCDEALYPYRQTGPDTSRLTRPNNDGPVRRLPDGTTISASQTLEFRPDGSVYEQGATKWTRLDAPVTISLTRKGTTLSIQVNDRGRISIVR